MPGEPSDSTVVCAAIHEYQGPMSFDHWLMEQINQHWTHPVLTRVMVVLSTLDIWTPLIALAVLGSVIFGGARGRCAVAGIGLAVLIADPLLGNALKKSIGELRPYQVSADVRRYELPKRSPKFLLILDEPKATKGKLARPGERGESLPSSHTANCFAAATALWLFVRGRSWLAFVVAFLVGYSRVYVGSHWPHDIPLSALYGALCGWLAVVLVRLIGRWVPFLRPSPSGEPGR